MELLLDNRPLAEAAAITEWQAIEFACAPPESSTLSLSIGGQALEPFLRPGDPAWRWRWNPQNAVGRFSLLLRAAWTDGRSEELRGALEVVPRKLDQERYHLLLDDLQRAVYTLAYAMSGGSAGAATQPNSNWQRTLIEEHFALFGERFDALERAVLRIAQRPYTTLRPVSERVEVGQVRDFSHLDAGRWTVGATSSPENLVPDLPSTIHHLSSIVQARSAETTDAYENRLLKRLLDELWRRARLIGDVVAREGPAARTIAERCAVVVQRLRELRGLPFLAEVSPLSTFHGPSQVMQRDPSYRTIYRFWQDLRRQTFLAVESPLFQLPLQELPRLYECWCAVQVAQALLDLPGAAIREQSLVAPLDDVQIACRDLPLTFALREDHPLLMLDWRDLTIRLRYQPRYKGRDWTRSKVPRAAPLQSLDRHTRVPDLAIEVERAGESLALFILDAKYRLDAGGGVPEDALADAYTYLGSIGRPGEERAVQAVVLLYPGHGAPEFYPSAVGALPLLPGTAGALREWVQAEIG